MFHNLILKMYVHFVILKKIIWPISLLISQSSKVVKGFDVINLIYKIRSQSQYIHIVFRVKSSNNHIIFCISAYTFLWNLIASAICYSATSRATAKSHAPVAQRWWLTFRMGTVWIFLILYNNLMMRQLWLIHYTKKRNRNRIVFVTIHIKLSYVWFSSENILIWYFLDTSKTRSKFWRARLI